MRKNIHGLLFVVMLFAASLAHAGMPAMPEIPTTLPDEVRQPLIDKRKPLANKKLALIDEAERNKKQCTNIVAGSEQHRTCLEMQKDFNARLEILRTEFEQLADEIDAAVDRNTIKNTDPMVVDARVPSGLPKGLDNAIANAYASAPPGVSDRVRKGFQAVMVRDWAVAKSWFQDALNHDPGNADLKHLVAFTDFSQQPNKQPASVDERNEPAGLGGKSDAKRADAPASKAEPATAGDRALSEQMFEDGLLYLNAGLYEAAEQMFRRADFQRNFDAGEPYSSSAAQNKTHGKTGKKK